MIGTTHQCDKKETKTVVAQLNTTDKTIGTRFQTLAIGEQAADARTPSGQSASVKPTQDIEQRRLTSAQSVAAADAQNSRGDYCTSSEVGFDHSWRGGLLQARKQELQSQSWIELSGFSSETMARVVGALNA